MPDWAASMRFVTIHRSQGSEYPAVVIPLTTASWMMLQRNRPGPPNRNRNAG